MDIKWNYVSNLIVTSSQTLFKVTIKFEKISSAKVENILMGIKFRIGK